MKDELFFPISEEFVAQSSVVHLEILVRRNMTRHGTFTTVRICAQFLTHTVSDFVECFFFF